MIDHLKEKANLYDGKHLLYVWGLLFVLIGIPLTVIATVSYRQVASKAEAIANDPQYTNQWALQKMKIPQAWEVVKGRQIVKIAILSTGLDVSGENAQEFGGRIGLGYNVVEETVPTTDQFGLGTNLASVIAAVPNNRVGIAGILWNSALLPVKVCSLSSCAINNVAKGVNWATSNGAKIIVLAPSFDSTRTDLAPLQEAINNASAKGVIVVTSLNKMDSQGQLSNEGNLSFPGNLANVVAVGSLNERDQIASWSGPGIDISAPGENILTLGPDGCCSSQLDPSLAAAHVAGVLGLTLSLPGVSSTRALECLYKGATDLGTPGKDATFGFGLVNAAAAVSECQTLVSS